jgi:hypothetical protein
MRHAPGRARTANLQFRRLSLYPVELRVLSIADMDDRTQPGFGKAKIRVLVEQQPLMQVIQKNPRPELDLPMRLPARGSDRKFRAICLMPITRLFEHAIPSSRESRNPRPGKPQPRERSLMRRNPVRGHASRLPFFASRPFCYANTIANHRS